MTATYTATVDRIVDGETAVVLLENDGDADDESAGDPVDQFDVDVGELPDEARHEGAILEVVVDEEEIRDATYRPELTRSRRADAQDRLDRLSERLSDQD
ncbi:DUF3006 domain-containing protein [Salinadaptatus halalkaliphilus]|uniref:DUF3006 domain-containing protein n=1 Tax=Salinadaptatus halalkaliphilus TaxID=2419781 RepID=A0A4S3TPJ9_9EURY|nr:DUF3006 domain-containing protein [Salinadaptatus halalkaliphilus]THE66252.1 DUF3006 domain-containing protein [Salinadaptatus halalkaliphilus]